MRAGKPLPVLYIPFTEGREANFSVSTEIQIHDRIYGHSYDSITAPVLV